MKNLENKSGQVQNFELGNAILQLIQQNRYQSSDIIQLFALSLKVSEIDCDEPTFELFSHLLDKVKNELETELCYMFYMIKSNYYSVRYNRLSTSTALEAFFDVENEESNVGITLSTIL